MSPARPPEWVKSESDSEITVKAVLLGARMLESKYQ